MPSENLVFPCDAFGASHIAEHTGSLYAEFTQLLFFHPKVSTCPTDDTGSVFRLKEGKYRGQLLSDGYLPPRINLCCSAAAAAATPAPGHMWAATVTGCCGTARGSSPNQREGSGTSGERACPNCEEVLTLSFPRAPQGMFVILSWMKELVCNLQSQASWMW